MGNGFTGIVVVLAFLTLCHAEALAQPKEPDSRKHLKDLCAFARHRGEPVCSAVDEITQDEAWVVLRRACADQQDRPTPPCVSFYAEHGGVLIFDVKEQQWRAEWEQAHWDLKFDVAGVPTVRLKPHDARPLKIIAGNISPLTYSAAPGTPKEEDLAVIAGLKTFLALAGTGIQGLIQTVTFSVAAGPQPSPKSEIHLFNRAREDREGIELAPKTACSIDPPVVAPLNELVAERNTLLADLNGDLRALERALEALDAARVNFLAASQKAEDGEPVASKDLVAPDLNGLQTAYGNFERSAATLIGHTDLLAPCQRLLVAYSAMLGAPADRDVLKTMFEQVRAIPACALASLDAVIRGNAKALVPDCELDQATLEKSLKLHTAALKPLVDRIMNARQVEEKVWQAIDKGRTSKSQVLASATTLRRQVLRGLRHTWTGTLIRELVVTRQNPVLPWNKVQTHTMVLTADSPYVKEITLARAAEQKKDYKLESATGQLLGYGIGVIYTPLHESTWTATAPDPTKPMAKVITETKRETRAGDLAAFLTYRFMEHWPKTRAAQPTLDLGVGLTSDRPAFFLGGGFEVKRAARISAGWAPERVAMLDASQKVNETAVTSNDDIKTVKSFQPRNWYVSFSFALDSLSLFNKP